MQVTICQYAEVFSQFLSLLCFIEIPVFNANSVDPDQMPCSAASEQDLHCLSMSLLWDARLKLVYLDILG